MSRNTPSSDQKPDQKIMKMSFSVLIISALASSLAYATSFDCNKASNFIEKAICDDPQLGKLDEMLSDNYKHVSASNIGESSRKNLKSDQRSWLIERNKCVDKRCLLKIYKKRIDEVCDFTVLSGAAPPCKTSDEE